MELVLAFSEADYIDRAIDVVQRNMVLGGLLAVGVLLLFLRSFSSTFFTSRYAEMRRSSARSRSAARIPARARTSRGSLDSKMPRKSSDDASASSWTRESVTVRDREGRGFTVAREGESGA